VYEYRVQFRNLIRQITDMAELDKVTYFVEGLKHSTKMEVNYRAPANFENTWKLAINYDTAIFGQGKPGKGTSSSSSLSSSRRFLPRDNYKSNNYSYNNNNKHNTYTSHTTPMELDLAESYKAKFLNKGKAYNKPNNLPKIDCYHCGKPGYYIKDYRATQPKAKIANIEEQTYDNHNAELTYLEDNKE